MLSKFTLGQTIRVVDPDEENHELKYLKGVVVRVLRRNGGREAWVDFGKRLPDALRAFPANDPDGRGGHRLLFADECATDAPREVNP